MDLDKKIYLATALAAIIIASAVAFATPRIAGDITIHVGANDVRTAVVRQPPANLVLARALAPL